MEKNGILRSPAERSDFVGLFQELSVEPLGTNRAFGVRRAYDRDTLFAERVTAENLAPYYRKRNIRWNAAQYIETFDDFENFILMFNGERAGVLRLQSDRDALAIRGLEVAREFWDKGLGTAAVLYAFGFARRQGESRIKVKTFSENPALRLYHRLGFEQVASDGNLTWLERPTNTF
jgi:GNAT superfamily N-acetyltransferase